MSMLLFLIGLFIGWNIPQPAFAKALQDKILAYFRRDKE